MPSRMATIAITTISSVSEKPVCRFMGRQCTGGGARPNRPCVTLAGPSDGRPVGTYGRSDGVHRSPKRARHSDTGPTDRSRRDGLQGLDASWKRQENDRAVLEDVRGWSELKA